MIEEITKVIKTLAEHLSSETLDIEVVEDKGAFVVNLKTNDEKTFVGKEKERFDAFSHLIKKILGKKIGEETRIIIDINNLRGRNDDALKAKASIIADRARAFKTDMELEPMNSYERRIIHAHLEGSPFIKTESIGEGKDRRLIIRYTEEKTL